MRMRHGLLAAALVAVVSFLAAPVFAAGLYSTFPLLTTVPAQGCIPADVYNSAAGNSQGVNPATGCLTPGQITGAGADGTAMGVYTTIPIGSVAYASLGTNTADVNGQVWITSLTLPTDTTLTGIACLQGGTATTDKTIDSLYNSAGTLVANSALAGTTLSGASTFQKQAFVTPYTAAAGIYYIGVQGNGTAAGAIATVAASTYLTVATTVVAGTFGTLPAITPPTTFTAGNGPICYVYK
jgi:hypothetical protein